jgi:quinol monooxygenase YgiN
MGLLIKMTIVRGKFAFIGEIPMITGSESSSRCLVDSTTRAVPGLIHAAIHRRIDGEGVVIYETRAGGDDDARTYRRVLEGHLANQRWYRPVGLWTNPGGIRRVTFVRTFRVVSEAGAKETVLTKLANLVALVIERVPELRLAILHEGLDQPEEIMLYEEWDSTKEEFLAEEAPKAYRAAYRDETAHLIAEKGDLEWLSPLRIYEGQV